MPGIQSCTQTAPALRGPRPRPERPLAGAATALVAPLLAVLAVLAAARAADAQIAPPVVLDVPAPPLVAAGAGGAFLVYELHVTNLATAPLALRRVEVLDDARGADAPPLAALDGDALARALGRPGVSPAPPPAERARLGGGLRAVVFLWVPVDARTPPARLRHRLTVAPAADSAGAAPAVVEGARVAVAGRAPVIGPPLRGGRWLAANGPDSLSGHRRALIPIDGRPAIAQRFAIDWVLVGDDGRTFVGDRERNESYHAEGQEAIAVADGIVAAVKDGIPENVPGITSRAVPITLETVGGNHVILDIGGGRHAFYAHLRPGSLRVRPGDRVRRGAVVGLVGNSGNSTEPHLHFHLMDGPSPLGGQGIPYVHESFAVVGRCRGLAGSCESASETRRGEMPFANVLVRYPD